MAQILSLIFKDKELCNALAFKGGTSLMFFHNLGRFSTDLDFNLLVPDKLDIVYDRVRAILTRFGTVDDEAKKDYGLVIVLNYGKGERMLKVEISTREYPNHYETLSLAGTDIRVMTMPDMFALSYAPWASVFLREIYMMCGFSCRTTRKSMKRL